MREIELEGKRNATTKYAIDCLAWATNRRGHNSWKGTSVIDDIFTYLVKNNVDLEVPTYKGDKTIDVNITSLKRTAALMSELGYATLTTKGKRFVHFEFKPDVILTGHTVRFKGKNVEYKVVDPPQEVAPAPKVVNVDLPLPTLVTPPYRLDEVTELLTLYSEFDTEKYAEYVDKLCSVMELILGR